MKKLEEKYDSPDYSIDSPYKEEAEQLIRDELNINYLPNPLFFIEELEKWEVLYNNKKEIFPKIDLLKSKIQFDVFKYFDIDLKINEPVDYILKEIILKEVDFHISISLLELKIQKEILNSIGFKFSGKDRKQYLKKYYDRKIIGAILFLNTEIQSGKFILFGKNAKIDEFDIDYKDLEKTFIQYLGKSKTSDGKFMREKINKFYSNKAKTSFLNKKRKIL